MYNILTLNNISEAGLSQLDPAKYTVSADVAEPDAILVRSAKMHDMEFAPNTLAIASAGAGTNNVPVDRCAEEGIVVFNTPGANSNAVKELVLCALFLTSRKIIPGIEFANSLKGKGDECGKLVEKGKSAFAGPEIKGKKLGVIGLGAIGVKVANSARNLGMEVYGYDPYLSVAAAWNLSSHIRHASSLDDIFTECDYITVHVPLTDDTKDTINKEAFAKMKDTAMLVNTARGGLIDTEALIDALKAGKFHAVGLDVYEGEDENVYTDRSDDFLNNDITARLQMFPNVILTSHQAFFTREALQAIAVETLENARNFNANLPLGAAELA